MIANGTATKFQASRPITQIQAVKNPFYRKSGAIYAATTSNHISRWSLL